MNILICLKSRVICEALSTLLKRSETGDEVFICTGATGTAGCSPDLIMVDHHSIGQPLMAQWPETKVLLIDTGLQQEEVINLLLSHKLDGVISTEADADLLKKAVKIVHEGQIWIDNHNLKALLCKAGNISKDGRLENVSKRERQILEFIKNGCKNKEIAARLYLSEQTVKSHISRIFRKFNVSSRSQLITLLMKN